MEDDKQQPEDESEPLETNELPEPEDSDPPAGTPLALPQEPIRKPLR